MTEYKGIEYLRKKLNSKRSRCQLRYNFYEMKESKWQASPVIPPALKRNFASCLGWCGKAVDSIATRLVFTEFANDDYGIQDIFDLNNPEILHRSAVLDALITSCSFLYIAGNNGDVRIQTIDATDATGIIDPATYLLTEGYAVLSRDERREPVLEAYFTKDSTVILERGEVLNVWDNPAPAPLLVPVIFKPDAKRRFGHSRISRACMNLQSKALATLTRADITAEFYSFPQKWVVGTHPDGERLDSWKAAITTMLSFDKDEDGDHPILGQFASASATPHIEHFRLLASAFAGETGLTLDDLGFASGNPSSSDAIKASHESLRLTARDAQRTFSVGLKNASYLACCVRDEKAYERKLCAKLKTQWEPLFEPDASMLSSIGDGAIKINQAIDGYFGKKNLERLTGIKSEDE